MTTRLTRYSVALMSLIALLVPLLYGQASAHHAEGEEAPAEDHEYSAEYTMAWDAAELAEDVGITQEEAAEALRRQARVGELQMALLRSGPRSYGGMYIQYQPEYAIKTLAEPHRGAEVRRAVDQLGFGDLGELVSIRETHLTEQALGRAQAAISRSNARFTWTETDLMRGKVVLAVETEGDADRARDEMRRTDLGAVPAERVEVIISGPAEMEDSYGGLTMEPECNTAWTVLNPTTGVEGVSTAGHCADSLKIGHHLDVALGLVDQKNQDSQDVQWHTTPNLDDKKQFRAWNDGSIQAVNSRTHRDAMVINQGVCHYGKVTGRGCGTIGGKTLDPDTYLDTNKFNATFIRVHGDATQWGDSGSPWFLYDSAYGIHKGSTQGCLHGGIGCNDPFFMAQNYTEALGIRVRVTGD